ncbi:MAG TPA: glycosyltransferase family 2 protein [Tepidisphaeraceae bacterium]|nr:glycosyltransferase family 2 protein [Tepidisphaeraceae bacterium]
MRVSIALCTYNGAAHLREQLDSLANQSRLPDEIVVNDDASTDNTFDVVQSFKQSTSIPIHFDRNDSQLNVTKNFERAFARCTGDLILPCDQDDYWRPQRIEKQIRAFERDPSVTFSLVQSELADQRLDPLGKTVFDEQRFGRALQLRLARGEGFEALIRHTIAPGHASAFRSSLRDVLLPIPMTCIYDQWLSLVASMLGRTSFIDERLVLYRQHEKQLVGREKTLADWARGTTKLDHLQRQFETLEELRRRTFGRANVDAWRKKLLDEKIEFIKNRARMRRTRGARYRIAARLFVTGKYHRLGRGVLTFARDLRGKT